MRISRDKITTKIFTQTTLGGRSEFDYAVENGKLFLQFGKMLNFIEVKENWIKKVRDRIQELRIEKNTKYKTQTSLYNQNKWGKCPNNRTCPYLACLIINQKIKL